MYKYKAIVRRVVDGDTVDMDIDLGFGVWLTNQRVRLYGVDTPETRTKNLVEKKFGKLAHEYVEDQLPLTKRIYITVNEYNSRGKFGRILGTIYAEEGDISINQKLVEHHLAVPYNGESRAELFSLHQKNYDFLTRENNQE